MRTSYTTSRFTHRGRFSDLPHPGRHSRFSDLQYKRQNTTYSIMTGIPSTVYFKSSARIQILGRSCQIPESALKSTINSRHDNFEYNTPPLWFVFGGLLPRRWEKAYASGSAQSKKILSQNRRTLFPFWDSLLFRPSFFFPPTCTSFFCYSYRHVSHIPPSLPLKIIKPIPCLIPFLFTM